jgi:UDP-N-acetylmuramate dehydrogenase
VAEGLQGFECLSGIPGSVGATPIQNVGAYGQEVAETVESVRVLDRSTDRVVDMSASECGFEYRSSVFKYHDRRVVLSVTFRLREGDRSAPLRYAELARALDVQVGGVAPLAEVREAVLALRRGKGMVIDPADPDSVSAGSFFTNPIVSERVSRTLPGDAPRWYLGEDAPDEVTPIENGLGDSPLDEFLAHQASLEASSTVTDAAPAEPLVKLSAAWLIEKAGIKRGFAVPGSRAAISSKHTLALTNRGGASAEELAQLARFVQSRVQAEFGITLRPEPVLIGVEL